MNLRIGEDRNEEELNRELHIEREIIALTLQNAMVIPFLDSMHAETRSVSGVGLMSHALSLIGLHES